MLFNSFSFIFYFLPVTLLLYFLLGRFGSLRWSGCWLTLASLVFYGVWNPWYLFLIVGSIAMNYGIGVGINNARHGRAPLSAKTLLVLGVTANLALLGYYKYANFFVDSCRTFLGVSWHLPPIVLPLAISFFTFTQIAYLVDAFHGVTEEYDFLHYALFVSFFPHLIAGPIVSYRRLMPQFAEPAVARFQAEHLAAGLGLFAVGLTKKVLIADHLSPLAQAAFDQPALAPGFLTAWIGALAYTFQLYFDFSAYSDMAIGLAWMFNVRFPLNFNSPYKAANISDFWRRWHMTLSHFLRDHLYIPLGGNRRGEPRQLLNLMITMLLGGLWHGAGWTFVVWGGLHGIYLIIYHVWERLGGKGKQAEDSKWNFAGWALTFLAVVIGWVFFRAHSLRQACALLLGMMGGHGLGLPLPVLLGASSYKAPLLTLASAVALAFFAPNADEIFRIAERYSDRGKKPVSPPIWHLSPIWAMATGAIFAITLLNIWQLSQFLYFRF
ncbi:MAG: MBOAT family protein [Methylacidiphilales bacterium]|nr:MBOAT family protein [Candidatus Methylacidiphilales bacterium]